MKQRFTVMTTAILMLAIFLPVHSFGQYYPIEGVRLGVEGGVLRGHTDKYDDKLSQAIRFYLRHDIVKRLDGDFAFTYGGIKGSDYQADLWTADYKLLYKPHIFDKVAEPYVGAGVGLAYYYSNFWFRSPSFDKSGYVGYIPIIAGIEFAVTKNLQFDINISGNYSSSDAIVTNKRTHSQGGGNNDGWWGAFVGISYTIFGGGAAEKAALRARELALAEARRVQDSINAAAEVRRMQDSIKAMAEALRIKEAQRIQDSTNAAAEAQRLKDSIDAAAQRLAELKKQPVALKAEVGKAIVLDGIVFKTGSAFITPASNAILTSAKKTLEENPEITVQIQGYTDNVGNAKTNLKLSQKRADAVKAWLVKNGIAASRITAEGYGDMNPRGDNETAEGRQMNRRIEFFRTK